MSCESWELHSGVAVDSTLLGCDTVVRSVIPTFWRVKHAFIFNVKQLHLISEVTCTSHHWQLLTHRHSITSQMTGMLMLMFSSLVTMNISEHRHSDITLVVCYKFGLSITVSWLLLNKSHWQHSSRVNITFMYHRAQEWLSMSVIQGPSHLPFLFRTTWHTTAHIHLTATFTCSSLLSIWDTLLYVLCVLFRSWTVEWTAMVSSVCQASCQTVKYRIAYSTYFGHSILYTISKIKGLLHSHRINKHNV